MKDIIQKLIVLYSQLLSLFIKRKTMLEKIASAIQEVEGYYPPGTMGYPKGSRSWRNKNPGNLKWAGQEDSIGKDHSGFAVFESYEDGIAALVHQLEIAANGESKVYTPDMTLYQFFSVFAPSRDNNSPKEYAETVASKVGVLPTEQLKDLI